MYGWVDCANNQDIAGDIVLRTLIMKVVEEFKRIEVVEGEVEAVEEVAL